MKKNGLCSYGRMDAVREKGQSRAIRKITKNERRKQWNNRKRRTEEGKFKTMDEKDELVPSKISDTELLKQK